MQHSSRLLWCWLAILALAAATADAQDAETGSPPDAAKATVPAEAVPADNAPMDDASKAKSEDAAKAKRATNEEFYEQMQSFVDLLDQVERNYVKNIDRKDLLQAAIDGVLDKLDPYSNYIPPEDLAQFETAVNHQFGGIGIQITVEAGQLRVMSPLYGTPAYRAGVHTGDAILEVDGKSTKGFDQDDAVKALKGEPGTSVALKLQGRRGPPRTVSLTRELVRLETVLGDRRKDDDRWDFMLDHAQRIGYIRLEAFGRETADDLRDALIELKGQELRGLVLDLRFNPGGLLSSAVEISDLFISSGRIVSTAGRNVKEQIWDAHEEGTFDGFPMVVLVNRFSASASEVVSACLQDHKRAIIVGERTWGKGSVQNVVELQGGRAALKLTTAGYMRPSGKNIHRLPGAKETEEWGVTPDELLRMSDSDLWRMQSVRRQRDVLHSHQEPQGEPDAEAQATESISTEPAEKPTDATSPEGAVRAADGEAVAPEKDFVDTQLRKAMEVLLKVLGENLTAQST